MPKSFLDKHYDNDFSKVMASQMVLEEKDFENLAKVTGTTSRTARNRIDHPENMPVWELKLYVKALKLSDNAVLNFIFDRKEER